MSNPKRKTYEVTGTTGFLDFEPGEQFTASLDPDLERRALGRGSIKVVPSKPKPSERESTE